MTVGHLAMRYAFCCNTTIICFFLPASVRPFLFAKCVPLFQLEGLCGACAAAGSAEMACPKKGLVQTGLEVPPLGLACLLACLLAPSGCVPD